MCWDTCNTDSMYPERIGNIIYFIKFPKPKQNKMSLTYCITNKELLNIINT